MNEKLTGFIMAVWKQIRSHPLGTFVTILNLAILFINSYSLSFLDYNNTRQQTYANKDSISQLSVLVSSANDRITILEQIAKDTVAANNRQADELSKINNNFTLYLEKNSK